ncbi:MAG: protein phosphatase CheZ [Sideroxydans sp.]|nr:protein phosphatase CheZ [Sideroxydans sp.]
MNNKATQDSDDLEALFDSIVAGGSEPAAAAAAPESKPQDIGAPGSPENVFNKIGQMTRALHDTLRELGLDKSLEKAAASIPDAHDRLKYVAAMTEQAAERVLNATDGAQPVVAKIESEAQHLSAEWQKLFDKQLDVEQFKKLATQTHAYLVEVPKQTKATNAYLMEIVMAQDFQDLTGQVIKKIMEITQQMEQQLVDLLVENAPPSVKHDSGLLNGPVVNASGRADVVTSQDQVDDLLESLGF